MCDVIVIMCMFHTVVCVVCIQHCHEFVVCICSALYLSYLLTTVSMTTVVPVMNGHPRDLAKVSIHGRWPLIRGTDGHVEMSRDIDNVSVHSRWPLTTGVAQGRYYCILIYQLFLNLI